MRNYSKAARPALDFFGEIVTTRSIEGLFVREMKLDWTWPALAVFTLALVWAGPANGTGDPRNTKHKETTVVKLQMLRAPELGSSSTCSL